MGILDWIKREGDDQEGVEFIDTEPPRSTHPDPIFRQKIDEIKRTKRELNWISWKIYRLETKEARSEFERRQLKTLGEKFKRMVKLHQSQEAELRRLQEQCVPYGRFHTG